MYEPVFNKVTSIRDALSNVTNFTYDSHGNLLTQKDPNGNLTKYQYDTFGELTAVTDPLEEFTVATPGALLVHVPPEVASLKVVVSPTQTAAVPVIAAGNGLTVTIVVAIQPGAVRV